VREKTVLVMTRVTHLDPDVVQESRGMQEAPIRCIEPQHGGQLIEQ
jgi:hypothetical protein